MESVHCNSDGKETALPSAGVDTRCKEEDKIIQVQHLHALKLYTNSQKAGNISHRIHYQKAMCHFNLGDFDSAMRDVSKAIELDSEKTDYHELQGRTAVKMKSYTKALEAYKRARELSPTRTTITKYLKEMNCIIMDENEQELLKSGEGTYDVVKLCSQEPYPNDREEAAIEKEYLVENGFEDSPILPGVEVDETRSGKSYMLAMNFLKEGNMENALKQCTESVSYNPGSINSWLLRSRVYFQIGEYRHAFQDLNVVQPEARTVEMYKLGGEILKNIGQCVTSEIWLRRASKLSHNSDREAMVLFQKVRVQRLYEPLVELFPIQVRFSIYGRGVYATENISPLACLMKDSPIVCAQTLDSHNRPACSHCAKSLLTINDYFGSELDKIPTTPKKLIRNAWPKVTIVKCQACDEVKYCSVACHDEAWKTYHGVLCPSRNKYCMKLYEFCRKGKFMVDNWWSSVYSPMMLAKIWACIVTQAKNLATEEGKTTPEVIHWAKAKAPYRRFIAFGISGYAKMVPCMVKLMADIFSDCNGTSYKIDDREFDGRFYQVACNTQTYADPRDVYTIVRERVARLKNSSSLIQYLEKEFPEVNYSGIFPVHACINHSCDNNAEVHDCMIEGKPGCAVRSKRPLKLGEEVFITYIDTTLPRKQRRAWLYRAYNFWCKCQRCRYEGDDSSTCTQCGQAASGRPNLGCSKCHKAWYCSKACQKLAWKSGHKAVCNTKHSQVSSPVSYEAYQM